MRFPRRGATACGLTMSALSLAVGCFQPEPMTRAQLERGYVVMLPGVEGGVHQYANTIAGLRAAGLDRAIDPVEWGKRPFGSYENLTDLTANKKRARAIAKRIERYHRDYPGRPITLIGYSGGGGLAVLTAEVLASGVQLDRVILIAAAIAPDYDLTRVQNACRDGVINFYSAGDWWTLGVGTATFGTIEREKTPSAGYVGLKDADGHLKASKRVRQFPWRSDWFWLGHAGNHTGWLARDWAREILAPQIDPSLTTRPAP